MDGADRIADADIAGAIRLRDQLRDVALSDRYDLAKDQVLLSGVQAMVRLPLMQAALDKARGWRTAGYITGYRGSPLGGVDMTAMKAQQALAAADIRFDAGLNEDLAATAIWGTQQSALLGRGTHEGVFALWYGKGPGLDRSGDVFRHANAAGAAEKGGVLVAMGDDHTGESSTVLHQTDITMMDAYIPVLHPAGPQEILDYGLIGWALSRFTGCWVGLKCLKDTAEATTVVDASPHRLSIAAPNIERPAEGLNIIAGEDRFNQERRLFDWRLPAVGPFARANGLDERRIGKPGAKIGVIASGKNWLDLLDALAMLGVDAAEAERLGFTAYKVGLAWPLEQEGIRAFAQGLQTLIVAEEKRAFIEPQVKEALYALPDRPAVLGKEDASGAPLFSAKMDLSPMDIALALGAAILDGPAGRDSGADRLRARLAEVKARLTAERAPALMERIPYFCSGCPHNSSTKVPEGSRAGAGIGCHFMTLWMDRSTLGFTQMGGEGANWIGESRFSQDQHIFQNLGDGTYNHSGLMAVRAAIAADVNITYKLLYNDAVAMTGGQSNEGGLSPYKIAEELLAAGVKRLDVVLDPKEEVDRAKLPAVVKVWRRDDLDAVQRELREIPGVTALLYIQTCAAEKRRRRKRGTFPDIPARVMINDLVCEGCGDCGVQSNCVSILPKETTFGRKRQIDQSNCNKDMSCIRGFCPSFVTVEGVTPKKKQQAAATVPTNLPEPRIPEIGALAGAGSGQTFNLLITGVGGTGVVTVGALLGMAAHLEGKGVGVMEMAGLAQKGGAVLIHCRIGKTPSDVSAIRVQAGEADAIIGGDLLVAGGDKAITAMQRGRTGVVCNDFEIITGAFTKDIDWSLPSRGVKRAIETAVGAENARFFNATRLAEKLIGDAIYANVLMLGAAWQNGLVPLSRASILRAIELNGAGVAGNRAAFELGRWAVVDPDAAIAAAADPKPEAESLDALIERRAAFLTDYQDAAWAARYREAITAIARAEQAVRPGAEALSRAAAVSLFKLMSYKDEYEVARLHAQSLDAQIDAAFDRTGDVKLRFHLAPPLIAPIGRDGKPRKIALGGWMKPVFGVLRHGKRLRGTALDPFGYTEERRMERGLIDQFERDLRHMAQNLTAARHSIALEWATLPQSIRGFGHVKAKNAADAAESRAALSAAFDGETASGPTAVAAE